MNIINNIIIMSRHHVTQKCMMLRLTRVVNVYFKDFNRIEFKVLLIADVTKYVYRIQNKSVPRLIKGP